MNINRNNYETWFLDYFEKRLTPERVEELMEFLELNYDLKNEFDNFENIIIHPSEPVVFEEKDKLKKKPVVSVGAITENNYKDYFIAEIENILQVHELIELKNFLKANPYLKKEHNLFCLTKLYPDKSIVFEGKEKLKKQAIYSVGKVNETNYAEYFIAAIEGDLDLSQLSELKEFLTKNPQFHSDYKLFGQTKLAIDTAIVFNRKEQLKKAETHVKSLNTKNLYRILSVAASVIILIALFFIFRNNKIQTTTTAQRNDIPATNNTLTNNKTEDVVIADTFKTNKINTSNNLNTNTYNDKQNYKTNEKPVQIQNSAKNNAIQYANVSEPAVIKENTENIPNKLSEVNANENSYTAELERILNKEKELEENKVQNVVKNTEDEYPPLFSWKFIKTEGKQLLPKIMNTEVVKKAETQLAQTANQGITNYKKIKNSSTFNNIVSIAGGIWDIIAANN